MLHQTFRGTTVLLRPLAPDDLDTVVNLFRATPNYFASIGYGRELPSKLGLQRELSEAARSDGRAFFAIVRSSDRALVGMADVQIEATMSDTSSIALLLIGGPFQKHGYGSEAADLLEQALCAAQTVEFIMAGVAESSALGQRFWQRRGYEYSGSTTHDPASSRSTVWMAKRCRPAAAAPAAEQA